MSTASTSSRSSAASPARVGGVPVVVLGERGDPCELLRDMTPAEHLYPEVGAGMTLEAQRHLAAAALGERATEREDLAPVLLDAVQLGDAADVDQRREIVQALGDGALRGDTAAAAPAFGSPSRAVAPAVSASSSRKPITRPPRAPARPRR